MHIHNPHPPVIITRYGGEQMPNPAELAIRQIAEARRRWSMWLLRGNDECEAYECDFCEDVTIAKRLKVADVVVRPNNHLCRCGLSC
jgi:hypothetical protein